MSDVCDIAVENMKGRAKLIRNDRTAGGQSRTAINQLSQQQVDSPPELPTAFPKVINLMPTLPCSPNACVVPRP
jgi:hypothetical protein